MNPFRWQWWRVAFGWGRRGDTVTFGVAPASVDWRCLGLGVFWRLPAPRPARRGAK